MRRLRDLRSLLRGLGSGVVAGASDNDPTTVATLSVIGSTTIYGLSWLVVLVVPMLMAIQVISARLGTVTHCSLQQVIRARYGHVWSLVSLALLVSVNLVTLAADLEGGGAALSLLLGGPWQWYVLPVALFSWIVLVFGKYDEVQRFLQLVALVFLAYIAAGIAARPGWSEVMRHTLVPTIKLTPDYIAGALALLGTTLTSYVYFWETIEQEEERRPRRQLRAAEVDAAVGIAFTSLIFWFILISSGATAGVEGVRVRTVQDAAVALAPIAGNFAESLFAVGLLASALLAVPILAATTAYAVVQAFGGRPSLEDALRRESLPFYSVITLSLILGLALSLLGIEPIQLLFWSGIAGGLGTPVLLALLLMAGSDPRVMGRYRVTGLLRAWGWFAMVAVSLAGVAFVAMQLISGGG